MPAKFGHDWWRIANARLEIREIVRTRLLAIVLSILQTAHLWANTGVVFRELSFSRLEYGVHDRLHIYPLCGVFYFPWHRHQIEGTNGFYCLIRKKERFTISNVESQVFTPNNSRLPRGLNARGPRPKRVSYHWTTAPLPSFLPFRYSTSLLGEPGSPSIVVLCGCAFVWTMSKICVKEVC